MRKKECTFTIKQIMPGNGWKAVYAVTPEKEGDPITATWEIVGWALVSHDGCCDDTYFLGRRGVTADEVVTLGSSDVGVSVIDDDDNLLCCIGPGEVVDEGVEIQARDYLERKAKR